MATKIIMRRGALAAWVSANPVLVAGEIGVEVDTGKFKIGDGELAWNDLSYQETLPQAISVECPANGVPVIVPELGFDPTLIGSLRVDYQVRGSVSTEIGIASILIYGAEGTIQGGVDIINGNSTGFLMTASRIDEHHVQVSVRVNNSQPTVAVLTPYFTVLTPVEPSDCPDVFDCSEGCSQVPVDCAAACEAWYNANCL